MKILFSLFIALSIMACNQKKNLSNSESSNVVPTTEKSMTFNNDCFKERSVTKEVSDMKMTIVSVMNIYMFSHESTRWQPCEIPEEFQTEGQTVLVSGQVLEIKPNERRAGTPFNLLAISKME